MKKPHSSASRERILQAAITLFAKQGYGNTGLRALSREADVNLAMINYFFGSKKELLKEILDIFFSGYLKVAQQELSADLDTPVKLQRFIHAAIAYFDKHREYLLVTISELPHDDPEITEHKANWGRQMVETIQQHLVADARDQDEIAISPVILCTMLTSMMASRFLFAPVMEQVQSEVLVNTSLQEYAVIISTTFLNGIGAVMVPEK